MNIINEIIGLIKNINMSNVIDLGIVIIIIILFWLISRFVACFIIKIIRGKKLEKEKIKDQSLYNPIKWYVRTTGFYIATLVFQLPSNLQKNVLIAYKIACILIIARGITDLFYPKATIFKKLEEKTNYNGGKALNNFVCKGIRFLVYLVAGYLVMLELGYNLGGLATGLGISSVVVALAAQDIAKNLFGGFAILTDKPFIVGDWIETKTYSGTVVDITFRSTRIKAIDNTIITVQNSTIVADIVKNWGKISQRRYEETLKLPFNTSKNSIEKLIKKIKIVLKTNKDIIPESLNVHFENFDDDGVKIFIYLNTTRTDYSDFEDFKDEINFSLLEALESENVKVIGTSKNIYIANNDE